MCNCDRDGIGEIKGRVGECRCSIAALAHLERPTPAMDDDIQFLGIVPSFSPTKSYVHPSHPPLQPPASGAFNKIGGNTITRVLTYPLIGIMLVIPKTTDEPTQTLRFLKSRSAVVHIGRASSSLVSDAEKSPDTVQFRCPVISRRHAKLMFSSGHVSPIISHPIVLEILIIYPQVYIVDLHSHHGTHLLRRDEIVSRPILPDVPIVLQDGDTLTFGKAVGKEPYSVSPITANVMLIYDTETGPTSPATPPIISLVDSPSPTTPIKSQQPVAAPKSSSSGRYGLFGPRTPCSPSLRSISSPNASSEEDFSQSDHDVEEDEDEDDEDDYPEIPEDYPFGGHGQAQSAGACYAPLPSLQGLGLLASRHVMHHAPPTHIHPHASHTHINMHVQSLNLERRPSLELWFEGSQRLAAPITANLSHEVGAEEPMDISSPPSPNPLHNLPAEVIENALASVVRTDMYGNPIPEEPPIIGAYPGSPIRSAVVSPWVDSEDIDDDIQCEGVPDRLVLDQPQQSGSQKERENASVAVEGTPASSVIAQASESADHLAEDGASDIDADGEADVDPAPPVEVAASFEPAPLAVPVAVVGPSSSDAHAPPDVGAITGSGMTIDARVTSLDEALVNLWVRKDADAFP